MSFESVKDLQKSFPLKDKKKLPRTALDDQNENKKPLYNK